MSAIWKPGLLRNLALSCAILFAPASGALVTSKGLSMRAPDVTVTMKEYAFEVDSSITSGRHAIAIRNAGHQRHLLIMTRLSPGKTSGDVLAWLERKGEAPGEIVLTTAEVKPGDSTVVDVTLTPGRYSLLCTVRGWWNRPHYKSGMFRDVVVR